MAISPRAQAVLLLTARFSAQSDARPLTIAEWAGFAEWLKDTGRRPEDLLSEDRGPLLEDWRSPDIERERLELLLDRGSALAVALDRWLGAGLWVLTRADPQYPARLKQRLGQSCPPVLFGCGDAGLLDRGGIAIVGSRNAPPPDLEYAWQLGARVAESGLPVISGGAAGVDEEAMAGALEAGGPVVGVLPSGLLGATAESRYRSRLMAGEMVLISPHQPEARFEGRNAKARNKYIYCIADAAVAVHAGTTGGTWSGASQVLREGWVPVWVRTNVDPETGNAGLIAAGGWPLEGDAAVLEPSLLFAPPAEAPAPQSDEEVDLRATEPGPGADALYQVFVEQALLLCAEHARTTDELAAALGLTNPQLELWLDCAVADGHLRKRPDPDRVELPGAAPGQLSLFEE